MNLLAKINFDKELLPLEESQINKLPSLLDVKVRSGVDGSRF
jgi:hypothetical protein